MLTFRWVIFARAAEVHTLREENLRRCKSMSACHITLGTVS